MRVQASDPKVLRTTACKLLSSALVTPSSSRIAVLRKIACAWARRACRDSRRRRSIWCGKASSLPGGSGISSSSAMPRPSKRWAARCDRPAAAPHRRQLHHRSGACPDDRPGARGPPDCVKRTWHHPPNPWSPINGKGGSGQIPHRRPEGMGRTETRNALHHACQPQQKVGWAVHSGRDESVDFRLHRRQWVRVLSTRMGWTG